MPFCTKCGTNIAANAAFCPNCGTAQGTAPTAAASAPAPAVPQSGLSQNAAATLSYLLGWITGIIFLLIDQRPYVRFHAAQSIVTFGGLHLIRIFLGIALGVGFWFGPMHSSRFFLAVPLLILLGFFTFGLWIYCMVKAHQGERFHLPVAGDMAEGLAGR